MLNKKTSSIVGVLLVALIFFSCEKRDFNLLKEKEMVNILTELYLTESSLDVMFIRNEQKKNLYYDNLFKKYNTTRIDFEKSAAYYAKDKRLEMIYEIVLDSLKAKELLVKNDYYHPTVNPQTEIQKLDTINIWTSAKKYVWHPDSTTKSNNLSFEYSDSNYFAQGDKFILYFLQSTARCDTLHGAYANMFVKYSNNIVDSVEAMLIPDERVRQYRMTVNNIDSLRPIAVYGNLLCYDSIKGTPDRWFDSIAILRVFDAIKNPLPDSLKNKFSETPSEQPLQKISSQKLIKQKHFDASERIELRIAN